MAVIPVVAAPGSYLATPVGAGSRDVAFTTMSGGADTFVSTGRELVLFFNSTGGALTVTITSQVDAQQRKGDITTYSIGAGLYSLFGPLAVDGWRDASGNVTITASAATLKVLVIRLP